MPVVEIFLLAVASMVWPTLIAVVVVALASPQPVRLLSWFLAGALLTTVALGTVIVFLLRDSDLVTHSRSTFDPTVYFVAGGAALVLAYLAWPRVRAEPRTAQPESHRPGWSERTLTRGAPLAFLVGIVLNVIPGVLPFVALKDIAELDYAPAASVSLVVGFYLIMFLPAEVPLGCFRFAPARTTAVVDRFNRWLKGNARLVGASVLAAAGVYLCARGIASL